MAKEMDLRSANYTEIREVLAAAKVAGEVVILTDVVGFYLNDGAIGDEMAVITKAEKVEVIKNAGEAWVPGDTLYWDDSASNVTVTLTSNTMIGYVQKAAESADVLGMIVFDGHLQFLKT